MNAKLSVFLLVVALSAACGSQIDGSETTGADQGGGGQLGHGGSNGSGSSDGGSNDGGSGDGGANDPGTVIQKDAEYRAMAALDGAPNCTVTGVNAQAQAVGYCTKALAGPERLALAVRWPSLDADPVALPLPPDLDPDLRWSVAPRGINDAGVIFGEMTALSEDGSTLSLKGIRWVTQAGSYEPKPFSTPEDVFVYTGAINADGEIAGGLLRPGADADEYGGFVWKDGELEMIAPLSSDPATALLDVVGFNTSQDILLAPGQVFQDGARTFLPIPFAASSASCTGVNEAGTAIGSAYVISRYRGLTWTKKLGLWTSSFLPQVFTDPPLSSDVPSAVNAEGDIAGTATRSPPDGSSFDFHVVVWTHQGSLFDLGNVPAAWPLKSAIPTPVAVLGEGIVVANLDAASSGASVQMPIVITY